MLTANFNITEANGYGSVILQGSGDYGANWQDIGPLLSLTGGALTVDDTAGVTIDTSIYLPGNTYQFRAIDTINTIYTNVISYRIPSIRAYGMGESSITFANNGGDNWTVSYLYGLDDAHTTSALLSMDVVYEFWVAGTQVHTISSPGLTAAPTVPPYTGQGAGTYIFTVNYNFADGSTFGINKFIMVNSSLAIERSFTMKGFKNISVSGLTVSMTADYSSTGTITPDEYGFLIMDTSFNVLDTVLGTDILSDYQLPTTTKFVGYQYGFDNAEWPDLYTGSTPYTDSSVIAAVVVVE